MSKVKFSVKIWYGMNHILCMFETAEYPKFELSIIDHGTQYVVSSRWYLEMSKVYSPMRCLSYWRLYFITIHIVKVSSRPKIRIKWISEVNIQILTLHKYLASRALGSIKCKFWWSPDSRSIFPCLNFKQDK